MTLLKLTLSIALIGVFGITHSQDYSNYYRKCNAADSLSYLGLNQDAFNLLTDAFQSVDYVHSDKLKKAYHLAIQLKHYEQAAQFGKRIIINSGRKGRIHNKSSEFKASHHYQSLKDSIDVYIQQFNDRINHDYINIIDSLYYIDQRIIRKNRSVRGRYRIDRKNLPENKFDLDSSNWALLSKLIDSLGFPSEQNVGSRAYSDAWIIIHHNLRLKENESYHPRIFEFIKQGKYLPENFSFWYEQYQLNVHGTTFFYTWNSDLSEENLKRINQNRRRFYLKGLNAFETKKGGRKITSKW